MGTGAHRQGDLDSGGNIPVQFSPDVKINGKFVHRVGDTDTGGNVVPSLPTTLPDGTVVPSSSATVSANGMKIVRIGDIDTGVDTKIEGSSDVIIGP